MFTLILLVILALGFSYFATENTQLSTITIAGFTWVSIPQYILIGLTLILGLSLSWIISLLDSISTSFKMRGKEHTIKDAKATIRDLTRKINELEIENAKLSERTKETPDRESM